MPRLLVDVNPSPRWVDYFRQHGIEAIHWSSLGACAAPDHEIMQYARMNGMVVFTNDLDFSAMLAEERSAQPSDLQKSRVRILPL